MASRAVAKRPYVPPTAERAIPLDEPINEALGCLKSAIALWKAIEPAVAKRLQVADLSDLHPGDLVGVLEKLSRTAVNLVKVTDEAARLRDMLTGGEVQRQDIASLGDRELQELLVETVLARGLWRLIRKRATERGVSLDAEVLKVETL